MYIISQDVAHTAYNIYIISFLTYLKVEYVKDVNDNP